MQITFDNLNALHQELHYDELTGIFTRKRTHRNVKKGDVAGSQIEATQAPGKFYVRICVLGQPFWAHRLAFVWMTGNWPTGDVDHIDQNSENNSWSNLRDVTKKENAKNLKPYKNNTSKFPGITKRASGKYRARIMVNGKSINLGHWDTVEEAVLARETAKKLHNFHENHC